MHIKYLLHMHLSPAHPPEYRMEHNTFNDIQSYKAYFMHIVTHSCSNEWTTTVLFHDIAQWYWLFTSTPNITTNSSWNSVFRTTSNQPVGLNPLWIYLEKKYYLLGFVRCFISKEGFFFSWQYWRPYIYESTIWRKNVRVKTKKK